MQTLAKTAFKKVVHFGLSALLIALAIATAALTKQTIELKRMIRDLQGQRKVDELIGELSVPTEAIYFDFRTQMEIAQTRSKCYQAHGTKRFLPYANVVAIAKTGAPTAAGLGTRDEKSYHPDYPTDNATLIYDGSCELLWHDRAWRGPGSLAFALENNTELATFLRQHPEVFAKRVQPLLLRLLDSYHAWPRDRAMHALLAWGDRSERTLNTLVAFLKEPQYKTTLNGSEYLKYGAETRNAARLVKKYGLEVGMDVGPILSETPK